MNKSIFTKIYANIYAIPRIWVLTLNVFKYIFKTVPCLQMAKLNHLSVAFPPSS